MNESHIELDGVITDAMGGGFYKIQVEKTDTFIKAKIGGKMKKNKVRVLPGDRVRVSVSVYDLTTGFISWRYR
jgi:translation initiation factor IF-1